MNIFVEIEEDGNKDNPCYINILDVSFIIRGTDEDKTRIMFKNTKALNTTLSTKEVMKKINKAYNAFENKEIIKKVTRFEIMDLED